VSQVTLETQKLQGDVMLGGISGLWFEGVENGDWLFTSLTDRGPNAEVVGEKTRPFVDAKFQPSILRIKLNPKTKVASLVSKMPLWLDDNRPVSGLPNDQRGEIPVTLTHQPLATDPNGLDPEAIVRDQDGSFWLAEEYGPSLVHFSSQGIWLERFIPQTTLSPGMQKTSAILPVQFAKRRLNRGFEALVRHQNKLFAFLQSSTDKNSRINLILEFDTTSRLPSAVYEFEMPLDADKISDAVAVTGQTFFAVVSDSKKGKKAKKYIIKVDLSNASNVLVKSGQLASTQLVLNLVDKGFDYSEKAEGLAIVDNNIIVVNDNDFEVAGPQATEFLIIPWEKL
jgi:hypothetical protein